jgi:hypothetical protein
LSLWGGELRAAARSQAAGWLAPDAARQSRDDVAMLLDGAPEPEVGRVDRRPASSEPSKPPEFDQFLNQDWSVAKKAKNTKCAGPQAHQFSTFCAKLLALGPS